MDNTTLPEQKDILTGDLANTAPYEKSLKNARVWLYIIAGFQVAMGVFEYSTASDKEIGMIAFGIDAAIGLIFFLLALWSKKKPVPAFTTALVLYLIIAIASMFIDPSRIGRGIVVKVFVVIALVKANKDSRKYMEEKILSGELD